MITIDGSFGEGGGQILRTCLSLSLVTGKPVHIKNIRAGRKKPGLLQQHLTAVNAAVTISRAECRGADPGSRELFFRPGKIIPGKYRFSVGTAGSATLVLQTILPALITGTRESIVTLEGGTHNPFAPPFDFLKSVFLKIINTMGPGVTPSIEQYGFYPAGGGRFTVHINPGQKLKQVILIKRGKIKNIQVRAISSHLPMRIVKKEVEIILERLGLNKESGIAEEVKSPGPGNAVMILVESEYISAMFTAFGRKGLPLEKVSGDVLRQAERYLWNTTPVGVYLADQLLIPMALAGGGRYRTLTPSSHTKTNCEVIKRFLDVDIGLTKIEKDVWDISVTR